jgi:surface protein
MEGMFAKASNFNSSLSFSNTGKVKNVSRMFENAVSFDHPSISSWVMTNVLTMENMFLEATNFNQPIGSWITSNVTNMANMFSGAISFNQPIGLWNTSNVTNMEYMFSGATNFNQPIGTFNIYNITAGGLDGMLEGCGMDENNYILTLNTWASPIIIISPAPPLPSNVMFYRPANVTATQAVIAAENHPAFVSQNWQFL